MSACSMPAVRTSSASPGKLTGRTRATVTRRLCTIGGFYRFAVEEELLDRSTAAHVRGIGSITSRTPPA
jgi:hypothetical protein